MIKLQNLLLVLIILFAYEAKSQTHACGTPPPDQTTHQYILNEIINHENDYAAAPADPAQTCIPVLIHIVRTDLGTGGFSPNLVSKAIGQLNNAFIESNVQFYACGINFIDNSDFFNYNNNDTDDDDLGDFAAGQEVTNAANVFVVNSIFLDGFGGAAGFAYYPANFSYSNRIVMDKDYMAISSTATLAHEFGHYFGLYHTHQSTENGPDIVGAERVVRTGSNANCATSGDLLCDTDADPRYSSSNINFCTYVGNETDDLGVVYNPVTAIDNIMSYYPDGCIEGFSAGQITRINAALIERQGHTVYDYSCVPDVVAPPTNLSASIDIPGTVKLTWTDNANNELGYIIERATTSNPSDFVPLPAGGTLPNATEYNDFGIANNQDYWYRIRPANSACDNYSNTATTAQGGGCPQNISGYNYLGEWNDSKYFISSNPSNWTSARSSAAAEGGHLVSITSQAENNQIFGWINEIVLIGLNDIQNEGTPAWDNGEAFTFNTINDQNAGDRDYGKMNNWNGNWGWDNSSVNYRHIMEVPCDDGGCTCPPSNTPVCGSDGVTYPNACEAECADIFNYTNGECSTGGCPDAVAGFTALGEFGNSKYYVSNEKARPVDAQAEAENQGGYLVTINNAAENNFIQQNISDMVYIGLNDYDSEGSLEWFNGETVSYNNVNPCGFCNENSGNQDFVIMAPWNGTWSFSNFFNSRKYVMEIPCDGGGGNDLPDLTLSNLENVTGNMIPGAVEFFEFDLNNIGNATATNSYTIKMFISTDQNLSSNDIDAGEIPTANTFVGTDANVPGAITVPNVSDGIYYLIIKVDSENNVQESNENNNTITSGQITIGSGGGACNGSTAISGFSYLGEYRNSRYYFSNNLERPTEAQANCENNGGYLASISSSGENDFIQQGVSGLVYIGLNDENSEGNLEWYSGESVGYNNINICSFCNENAENQDYVVMTGWNGEWSWSNFWNKRRYVMEVPCNLNSNNTLITIPDLEKEAIEFMAIVPNPAHQFVGVQLKSNEDMDVDIQIFDSRGVLVQSEKSTLFEGLNGIEMNISNLAAGMYWINIPQANRNHSVKKFVKITE